MTSTMSVLASIFISILYINWTQAGKVLISPNSLVPAHRFVMRDLAQELIKRGHTVVWWEIGLQKSSIPLPKGVDERFWKVDVPGEPFIDMLFGSRSSPVYEHIWSADVNDVSLKAANWMASLRMCERVLQTRKGDFDKLVGEYFDTAIIDDLYNPCGLLHVGLQKTVYVLWSMTYMRTETAWSNQSPSPPSYIPVPGTGFADELNFWQRSYNLAAYLKQIYIHQRVVLRRIDSVYQRYYPGVTESFYIERNASVNYINTPAIFDFPRPFMPRVYFVGGLHCRKAEPLTGDLATFVNGADDQNGFMLFTTGFTVPWTRTPKETVNIFVESFKAHPNTKFVWQYSGPKIDNLPSNVFVADWLPQQDLLGHEKCKAFITHGGLNSLIEAMWHGVPVIGIPIFTEHYDNLVRITARKAGFMVEKKDLNTNVLTKAIRKIRAEKHFLENTKEFQDLVIDVPYTELNHSAFWVEFIMRHQEVFYTCKMTCRACGWGCRKVCGRGGVKVDEKKKKQ